MFRMSLMSAVVCFFMTAAITGANASEFEGLEGFDDIFGNITSVPQKRYYDKHISVQKPYFGLRPKGQNTITAKVDLSDQLMRVYVNDKFWQEWKVSSGARGYRTPTGKYKPTRMHKQWFSRTYDNTPMPHSIFFYHGYAIHATLNIRGLGRARSHGCVRLHPDHARAFFEMVKDFGMHKTKIIITR